MTDAADIHAVISSIADQGGRVVIEEVVIGPAAELRISVCLGDRCTTEYVNAATEPDWLAEDLRWLAERVRDPH